MTNTLKDLDHRDAVKEKQRLFLLGNIFILSNILSAQTTQCHILYGFDILPSLDGTYRLASSCAIHLLPRLPDS